MANIDLFINSYLERISKKFEIPKDDAFEVFSIATILEIPFDEVFNNVIIRESDGGIDGIFFSEDQATDTMHIFQCKNSKKFGQNQIEKFKNDFEEVFVDGNTNKQNIAGLRKNIEKLKNFIIAGKIVEEKLYFIYNGKYNNAEFLSNKNLTDDFHEENKFEIWDSQKLYNKIVFLSKTLNKRKQVNFTFKPENSNITSTTDNQGLISFAIYQVKAALFRIPALQICALLDREKEINGTFEKVFAENIRGFLGNDNITNSKILETINSDNNVYFPFLNNGITIICEEFQLPYNPQLGKYNLPSINPVIVNGLQTTYLLYQEYKRQNEILKDVYVTVKLYETDNAELVDLITDATNTQSNISFKDKISNKKFNNYTKILFENRNIYYLTKRGEIFTVNTLSKSVQNTSVLVLWYASFYELPEKTQSKELIYKEIFLATGNSSHILYPLFNGDQDSALYGQLFLAYAIPEIFNTEVAKYENSIDNKLVKRIEVLRNLGNEYITYLVYMLIKDKLDVISNDIIVEGIDLLLRIINTDENTIAKYAMFQDKNRFINSLFLDSDKKLDEFMTTHNIHEDDEQELRENLEFFLQSIEENLNYFNNRQEREAQATLLTKKYVNIDNIVL